MNLSPFLYGLSELIGVEATLKLVGEYGGTTLYVPMQMLADHPIAQLIGQGAAQKLACAYPGSSITIALHATGSHAQHGAQRRKSIRELKAQGLSHREIALALRTTDRTVRKVLGQEVDDRQQSFFLTGEPHESECPTTTANTGNPLRRA